MMMILRSGPMLRMEYRGPFGEESRKVKNIYLFVKDFLERGGLFEVVFEIVYRPLADVFALFSNDSFQPLRKLLGGVVPVVLQEMVECDHLADHRYVLSREDGQLHSRELDLQDRGPLVVEPGAGVVFVGTPLHQLDHQFYALLKADGPDAEHAPDVDQAEAPDFHEVLHEVGPRPHQYPFALARDHDHVVCHETVAPLDQVERDLAFPDPGPADQEDSDPVDVDKRAVDNGLRGKLVVQEIGEKIDELGRLERCPENRHLVRRGDLEERVVHLVIARDHDQGNVEAENPLQGVLALCGLKLFEIADLRISEHLHPVEPEQVHESRQREAGPVDVLVGYLLFVTDVSRQGGQPEPRLVRLDKEADRDASLLGFLRALQSHSFSPASPSVLSSFTRRRAFLFFMRSLVLYFASCRSSFTTTRSIDL